MFPDRRRPIWYSRNAGPPPYSKRPWTDCEKSRQPPVKRQDSSDSRSSSKMGLNQVIMNGLGKNGEWLLTALPQRSIASGSVTGNWLSLIHISEPTRLLSISYA